MRLIFNPDKYIKPNILLNPFDHRIDYGNLKVKDNLYNTISNIFSDNYVITKDGREAIDLALKDIIKLNNINNLNVLIITSSLGKYVSSCVTNSIENFGSWTMNPRDKYNCIFIIHEFGSLAKIPDIIKDNIPVIEDFAPSFFLKKISTIKSKYKIFSFPKFFSVQEGGLITGINDNNKRNYKLTDYTASILEYELVNVSSLIKKRKEVESTILKEFIKLGFKPFYDDYLNLIPWVLMIKNENKIKDLKQLKLHFENHGILIGVFYGNDSFYLPCHQNLDKFEINYIINVFKNFL